MLVLCACGRLGFDDLDDRDAPTEVHLTYPSPSVDAVLLKTEILLAPVTSEAMQFSISPELPAGVRIDPVSGVIAGTPEEAVYEVDYVVTGTAATGSGTATLRVTVLPGHVVDATIDAPDDDGGVDEVCYSTTAGGCTLRAAVATTNRRSTRQLVLLGAGSYVLDAPVEPISNDVDLAGQGVALTTIRPGTDHPGYGVLTMLENHALRLRRATFQGFGPADGGVILVGTGRLEVDAASFVNNRSAGSGGVMFIESGASARLRRSTFDGNLAANWGGVIHGEGLGTNIVVEQCTATNNTAAWGSFSHIMAGTTLRLENSTLYGNKATSAGTLATPGGIYTLVNDTIAHNTNTAPESAGLYVHSSPGTYTVGNTILAFNTDATGGQNNCNRRDSEMASPLQLTSRGGNLISDGAGNCAGAFTAPGDRLSVDPGLDPAGPTRNGGLTDTVLLSLGSEARDAGRPDECPAEDQRGVPRIDAHGRCDAGAIEMP